MKPTNRFYGYSPMDPPDEPEIEDLETETDFDDAELNDYPEN